MRYNVAGQITPETEWEDFYSDNVFLPRVSIGSDAPEKLADGRDFAVELAPDGWYDGYVRTLTVESAKMVLAEVNGVKSEDIELIQLGSSESF
ncbi:hypothetical protein KKB41_00195 [Patescibacteria group bacterium]|nr:hypothetical protein [Patescibacteria group bacterium]